MFRNGLPGDIDENPVESKNFIIFSNDGCTNIQKINNFICRRDSDSVGDTESGANLFVGLQFMVKMGLS